jgi:hypothetical protein
MGLQDGWSKGSMTGSKRAIKKHSKALQRGQERDMTPVNEIDSVKVMS